MERSFGLTRLGKSLFLMAAIVLVGCGTSTAASPNPTAQPLPSSTRGNHEELLRQGADALKLGRTKLAIEDYKAALEAAPPDPAKRGLIEFVLGIAYQKAQHWQESADTLNAAIRDNDHLGYLAYSLLGFCYQHLGRWQEALGSFQQAAKLKPDDLGVQAGLGAALIGVGRPKEAIAPLESVARRNPTLPGNHFALGLAYSQTGQLEAAINEFKETIRLDPSNAPAYLYLGEAFGMSKRSDDQISAELHAISLNPKLAGAHYLLGTAYGATNRLPEAASEYQKALDLKPDYFDAYAGLASADVQLQRWSDSWRALQASERLNGSTNSAAYLNLAISYQTFGLWQQSVNSVDQAIKLKPDCVECYWLLGNGYENLGRAEESRKAYENALVLRPNYPSALAGLGQLAETSGDFAGAQHYLDAATRSLGQFADANLRRQTEASILLERGNIERDRGNYAPAFDFYTRAIEGYRSIGNRKEAGATLAKVAEVYRQIGDYQASAQWYDYSLQESQRAGDVDAQMTALLRLDYLAAQIEDRSALAKYEQEGEQLAATVFHDRSRALNLATGEFFLALGEIMADYGSPSDAIKLLEPLVAYYRKLPQNEQTLRRLAFASGFLGEAYMRAARYRDALDAFSQAQKIAETHNSPEVMRIYARMGDVYEKQGDLDSALYYGRRAAEALERFAAAQELPELQLSSQELAWGPYENLTRVTFELYAKTHSVDLLDQAFAYHEQARTRALRDLLNEAGIRAREGVDPQLVRQEDSLRAKLVALQSAFSDITVSELRKTSLEQALTTQVTELRHLHDKIAATNAKYEIMAPPGLVRLADVQKLLNDDTVLLEYDLGPAISGVGFITRTDKRIYRLPAQATIDEALQQFLPTLREPLFGTSDMERHVQFAKQLYVDLVRPFHDQIAGKRHIVIVPDGDLFYLPFEAIIDPDAKLDGPADSLASQPYLGKTYDFSYAPSASVLVTLDRIRTSPSSAQHPLLAFGDPVFQSTAQPSQIALSTRGIYEKMGVGFDRLSYSAEEVRGIIAVYGISPDSDSVYVGSKATKKALLALDLSQYRTLHFATHAVMGDEVRWITQPALIFSPDGTGAPDSDVLKMSDIFNLRLNANLVVLSACETARGKMSRGEGIVGLTSAFLFAGSRSVVASLWNVNDESTSLFMESFYTNLKNGRSKADALREARLQTMRREIKSAVTGEQQSLASPFFWAPFVLIGEWN